MFEKNQKSINESIQKRAEYSKQIVVTVSRQLEILCNRLFEYLNFR